MGTATPQKILVLSPNWIGDAVMCTPAFRALWRRFPDAWITLLARKSVCELLAGLPWFAERVAIPHKPGVAEITGLATRLRPNARDLAVIFTHSFRSALLAWLAGARRRVAYDRGGRGFLLTDRIPPYCEDGRIQPIYMATEYTDLVKCLGCEDDGVGLELSADPDVTQEMARLFHGPGPRVGIAPGAAFGPSKLWPAERYAAVADALAERAGAQCILLTGPGEESIRNAVIAAAKHPLIRYDHGAPSIERLKATVSFLDLLIGNDSGTRHIAVAFHVPTICIMGPTSPRYSEGPYERGRVLRVDVDCGPCQKPVCETDHRCMTRISVETVTESALEILVNKHVTLE